MSLSLAGAETLPGPHARSPSLALPLGDLSRVGEARRLACALGGRAGLSAAELNDLGIVVNEITTNAVRHAGGGELVLRLLGAPGAAGVELLCIDRGPGMASVAEASRDGFSTGGTMGTGLGAAGRIAHLCEVHSMPGAGTVVLARIWAGGAPGRAPATEVAGICLPVAGEAKCGDAWSAASLGARRLLMVADGLGHGEGAAEASELAVRLFDAHAGEPPEAIVQLLHGALRATRGAALAVAEIDLAASRLRYVGVGNIGGRIVADGVMRALVSHHGIVGHQMRRVQAFDYPWSAGATLVMQSDGVTGHWKTESWPGLLRRDPALLAAVIYRDCARERDDSAVVVFRSS